MNIYKCVLGGYKLGFQIKLPLFNKICGFLEIKWLLRLYIFGIVIWNVILKVHVMGCLVKSGRFQIIEVKVASYRKYKKKKKFSVTVFSFVASMSLSCLNVLLDH